MTEDISIKSTVTLSDGVKMPRFGLGTWRSPVGQVTAAVELVDSLGAAADVLQGTLGVKKGAKAFGVMYITKAAFPSVFVPEDRESAWSALEEGYVHVDCAWCYFNQEEVGSAIAASLEKKYIKREDLFVTTKLWNTFHRPKLLRKNMETCLKDLGLAYVDHVQLHYSFAMVPADDERTLVPRHENGDAHLDDEVTLEQTWKAMEAFVDDGLAKSIGVSNFTKEELEHIMKDAKIMPSVLQVEITHGNFFHVKYFKPRGVQTYPELRQSKMHPYLNNEDLLQWCKGKGVHVTAYAPLGNVNPDFASALEDPIIGQIAERVGKSPAQVIIRWHLQRGVTVIPKSVTPSRILANKDVFDFDLSEDDMLAMGKLGERKLRMCNWKYRPGGGRIYEGETSAYPEK